MTGWRAMSGVLFVGIVAARASAQRPSVAPPLESIADSISAPFIPGGHWGTTFAMPATGGAEPSFGPLKPAELSPDGVPYFARPNGLLLRTGAFSYQLSLRRDTTTIPLGVRTVTVSESMLGGIAGWLIAESRSGTPVATTDSLYLHRGDLTPERWAATIGRTQLAVSFTPDSMFAAVQYYQGRGSFATPIPPGALISAGMIDRMIELLPLSIGYRSAASLVQVAGATPRVVPAEIAVTGEESVALLDRAVDCWVVTLHAATVEKRYWVSKDSSRLVKTEQWTSGGLLTEVAQGYLTG